jgi:hypothetical protein
MSNIQTTTSPKKTAETLLIYDENEWWDMTAPLFAEQVLKCNPKKCTLKVKSWEKLVSQLQQYETIDHLVLYFHGAKGALFIGGVNKQLSEAVRLFKRNGPRINKQIDFEACRVAQDPKELITFARFFKAPKITAYNYFYVDTILPINVEKTDNVKSLLYLSS